jgi:uncharacterized protein with GYD domain
MATYVSLIKMTPQGAQSIKEVPQRVAKFRELMKSHGAEMKSWHLTMGSYDVVAILEAPDDETAAKLALALSSTGNTKTETLRAFSFDEFEKMVATLPTPPR